MKAEGRTDLQQGQKKKKTAHLRGLRDLLPLCSSEFSAEDSPAGREGHISASHSWWRVCKSMWRAKEQESRARFGFVTKAERTGASDLGK